MAVENDRHSPDDTVEHLRRAGHEKHPEKHLVEITVDHRKLKIAAGPYRVSVFKHEVGVPPEKELDQIIKGVIKPLDDNATIVIAGGEVFISHERTGAAS